MVSSTAHVPLWLSVSYGLPNSLVSTIMVLGNPAVWWVGFACVLLLAVETVQKREFAGLFITVFFFFQWFGYVFIERLTFIYHFYLDVPFLCLASAYFLNIIWIKKWGKIVAVVYFASVVLLFWLFYPVISGMPVSQSVINGLKWFKNWLYP